MVETIDKKMAELQEFMAAQKKTQYNDEASLIAILHKAQELYGYLSTEAMDEIAVTMKIPTAHIWGVATFYHYFCLTPKGKYVISVCLGTACYVKGADEIQEKIKSELKIKVGETTPDGLFTLQEARCLGACGIAPVIMINDKIYGTLTPKKVTEILNNYRKLGS
jgi:NADH-quinone oxidoreductase subunit E/NADP-reducing hydrogenase subunit HndA